MAKKSKINKSRTERNRARISAYESSRRRSKANKFSFSDFFKSDGLRFSLGILLVAFILFSLLSYVSYFFTGAADQSLFDNQQLAESVKSRYEAKNWMSVVGAKYAELFINNYFGVLAFVLLFFLTTVVIRVFQVLYIDLWKSFFKSFFWIIWGSVFLGFLTNLIPYLQPSYFFLGGGIGDYAARQINSFIGIPGTFLLLLALLLIYFIFISKSTVPFLKNIFKKKEKKEFADSEVEDLGRKEKKVAVGTEILPDDWVEVPGTEMIVSDVVEEKEEKEEENSVEVGATDEVDFEITTSKADEEDSSLLPDNDKEANYNIEQLGKYDPTLDLSSYKTPNLALLKQYPSDSNLQVDMTEQQNNKDRITTTLKHFGIEITSIKATVGPTITLYEIVPKSGIRISKIRNLESDIMLSLAATGIRIIAPIPGKGTIGIEVPNNDPQIVSMFSVLASKKFSESKYDLPIAFGKTITNDVFVIDLAKMPHLLVAGATGQGKSVGLNAIITSLLYKKHPAELKFVLIDPKKVEFNIYGAIEKHFLAKLPDGEDAIITDTSKVVETLNSLTVEMDQRYDLLKKAHVRNVKEYNEKFINRSLNPEKGHRFLPYIVVVVDEFGDLIMTAGKEVEMPIARIAQLARAVGIHMVIATQRPSVNIITGVIKANFPARVAFRVSSMIDSRTILDAPGANQLVGRGDMLFSQGSDLVRVQCAFIDTPEVEGVANDIGGQRGYPTAFYLPEYTSPDAEAIDPLSVDLNKRDALFEEAARMIVASQQGSTSMIQRKFSIGYNRAGRLADQLEAAGIVGPAEGSKPRQVLVQTEYELNNILNSL